MHMEIRKARSEDSNQILLLTEELGYRYDFERIMHRLKIISKKMDEVVFVAEGETVFGWIHAALTEPLESDRFAEIRGLVVKEGVRGKGAGTKLIHKAEEWSKEKGCCLIRVRTNIKRKGTREYYLKLGYTPKKIQEVFEKKIK